MKEYGGYHFEPAGNLDKKRINNDIATLLLANRTELKLWDESSEKFYGEKASTLYTHEDFYKAMGDPDDDLIKRYIYVGVSRAAFFLGITLSADKKDITKYFKKGLNWGKV